MSGRVPLMGNRRALGDIGNAQAGTRGAAGKEGMAFAVGYIRALIQVVYADELRRSVEDPPTYANPRL